MLFVADFDEAYNEDFDTYINILAMALLISLKIFILIKQKPLNVLKREICIYMKQCNECKKYPTAQ